MGSGGKHDRPVGTARAAPAEERITQPIGGEFSQRLVTKLPNARTTSPVGEPDE
jgi:hypothetical protein